MKKLRFANIPHIENILWGVMILLVIGNISLITKYVIANLYVESVHNEEGKKSEKSTTWYEPENWYSFDRKMESEGVYDNGKKVGEWTDWYENGKKESEGVYDNGKKVGEWTDWYENGKEKLVTNLDENGNLIKEERMSDCGNVTVYYNTDGSVNYTTESPDREKFRKKARQFANERLSIMGRGINFNSSNSPFSCRYNFTGTLFDKHNNPQSFSISVNYNGYSWDVVNVNIQRW